MRFILYCLLAGACFSVQASDLCNQDCRLIIDAGSSGSRVHLFQYKFLQNGTDIDVKQVWTAKTSPGLSQISLKKDSIDQYLQQLMKDVPPGNYTIYFYGTAGMRLLSKTQQAQYYAIIQDWFISHYPSQLRSASTISGQTEAAYGWLSVNQQLHLLDSGASLPAGVLDLGGASVQISIPVNLDKANTAIKYLDKDIYLQSFSFIGLGQNEVQHQLMDDKNCYAIQYPMMNDQVANGDVGQCVESASRLINDVHHVNETLKSIAQKDLVNRWVVMGSMVYTANAEPLHYEQQTLSAGELLKAAQVHVCEQSWDSLVQQYPDDERLDSYCLYSSYYYALIVNGFGLKPDQVLERLAEQETSDWTTGALIDGVSSMNFGPAKSVPSIN